jgi:hypothetical protein
MLSRDLMAPTREEISGCDRRRCGHLLQTGNLFLLAELPGEIANET